MNKLSHAWCSSERSANFSSGSTLKSKRNKEMIGNDRVSMVFGNRVIWLIWKNESFQAWCPFQRRFVTSVSVIGWRSGQGTICFLNPSFNLPSWKSVRDAQQWWRLDDWYHHFSNMVDIFKVRFSQGSPRRDWSYMHEGWRQLHPLRSFCHSERQSDCRSPTHKRDWETMQVFRCPRNHGSWNLQPWK